MFRLAIISTHPIQYNAPLFKMLAQRNNIIVKVFYTWSQLENSKKYDPGFQKNIDWDIPLLDGYDYMFVKNIAKIPGSHHFSGIKNPTLLQEIYSWKPNAVLVYGWSFKSHLNALRYFKNKVPILFRGDSTLLDETTVLKSLIRKLILSFVYKHIDVALYAGEANKKYFEYFGLKERQLVFMPHAIDNNRFAADDNNISDALALRNKMGIPHDAVVFLFVGKLEEKKQPDKLIKVFSELVVSNNTYLLVVGSGALEAKLRSSYINIKNIKFLGFQNQQAMPAIYNSCQVFVLPSKGPNETWGLAINEAMAAGKAIICTDKCSAAADLVKDGINGFVVNSNDEQALKSKMGYFVNNINIPKEMGKKSLTIIENYSYAADCIAIENTVNTFCKK